MAVNNLLSRDEEDGDDADDAQDNYVPEVNELNREYPNLINLNAPHFPLKTYRYSDMKHR